MRSRLSKDITITQLTSSPLTQIKLRMGTLSLLGAVNDEETTSSLSKHTWELSRHRSSIGSLEGCDLYFSHPTVSRQHAYIEIDEQGYRLVDTQSKNGVFINQTRVLHAFLSDGDIDC